MATPTRRAALLLAACAALACSEPAGDGGDPRPRQATPLAGTIGVTAFAQAVARGPEDATGLYSEEVFPGQSNTWVLDRDFSLAQGFGGQYFRALALHLGEPSGSTHGDVWSDVITPDVLEPFPFDQAADEVAFLSPLFTVSEGVRTVAVSDGVSMGVGAIDGRSAFLNGTSGSRLGRPLSLPGPGPYAVEWSDAAVFLPAPLDGAPGTPQAPSYRVVLRDPASDELLETLSSVSSDVAGRRRADLPAGLPAEVELSFELRGAAGSYAVVDGVVLWDGELAVTAGDFEAGLGEWTANAGAESQNGRSGSREVGLAGSALRVTRTFYAPPAAAWARLVDLFENEGPDPVATSAVYATTLGGTAPLAAVRAGGRAVVGWDAARDVRDVGLVAGSGQALVADGSAEVFFVHPIAVPAGGKVAIVHFVVQLGAAEGGIDAADVPEGTDATCAAIAAGFPADAQYAIDLEPGVLEAVANF
jgi:hypothetical protein